MIWHLLQKEDSEWTVPSPEPRHTNDIDQMMGGKWRPTLCLSETTTKNWFHLKVQLSGALCWEFGGLDSWVWAVRGSTTINCWCLLRARDRVLTRAIASTSGLFADGLVPVDEGPPRLTRRSQAAARRRSVRSWSGPNRRVRKNAACESGESLCIVLVIHVG